LASLRIVKASLGRRVFGAHRKTLRDSEWERPMLREDGSLGEAVSSLNEDKGNLWVGVTDGLWRWKPVAKILSVGRRTARPASLAEGDDGGLLIAFRGAIIHWSMGKRRSVCAPSRPYGNSQCESCCVIAMAVCGPNVSPGPGAHTPGRTDVFAQPEGLSGNDVSDILRIAKATSGWLRLTARPLSDSAVATYPRPKACRAPMSSPCWR